jgi:hypothetical protein
LQGGIPPGALGGVPALDTKKRAGRKEKNMRYIIIALAALALLAFSLAPAVAEQGPVETVLSGCKAELESYCKDVTPGQGRILACLYAHGDKLSGKCEFALYDAAAQLERAVAALTYVASECEDDLDDLCAGVPAGKGRLLSCLEKQEEKVSARCIQALKDVGLK